MEVSLVNHSVYTLPSSHRVDCIVFDGTIDMQLWRGPGAEKELAEHYGDGLQLALDNELKHIEAGKLEFAEVIRVHPGRLHCNFLAWLAMREPEPSADRSSAPEVETIKKGVMRALEFAAERNVEKIAFGAIGGGPGEIAREDRLVHVVRTAHEYQEQCTARGVAPVVEEVYVCEGSGPIFRSARDKMKGLAKAVAKAPPKAKATKKKTTKKARKTTKGRTRKALAITAEEVAQARGSAEKYSMRATYAIGDFFVHPKFGVGKVVDHPAAGQIFVAFADGSEKKLVHSRA